MIKNDASVITICANSSPVVIIHLKYICPSCRITVYEEGCMVEPPESRPRPTMMQRGRRCIPHDWLSSQFKSLIYSAASFGFFLLIAPSSVQVPLSVFLPLPLAAPLRTGAGWLALAIHHRTEYLLEFGIIVPRSAHQNAIYHQLRNPAEISQLLE